MANFGNILSDLALAAWTSVRRSGTDGAFEAYDTRASRPLFEHFQTRTTVSTSAETSHLYQISRGQFAYNGDRIIGQYTGKTAANANDKYIRLKWASTELFDSSDVDAAIGNNKKWRIDLTLTRTSTSTLRYSVEFTIFGFDSFCSEGEITSLDFPDIGGLSPGTAYDLKLELETPTAAGDASLMLADARFVNAGAADIVTTSIWAYYEADAYNGSGVSQPTDGSNLSASWQDLSGNARHATVTGSPTYETNERNGLAIVRLGADSNDYFTLPTMAALSSCTMFAVWKVTNTTTGGANKFGSGTAGTYPDSGDGNIDDGFCSTVRKDNIVPVTSVSSYHVARWWSATNDWGFHMNGMKAHETTTNTTAFSTTPTVGFNGSTQYMKADLAAFYIYSNKMSDANVAKMHRYLGQKWGV